MSDLPIRQATLTDKSTLFNFLRLAYPDRWQYKFPERWEWEFERNPFLRGDGLPIWIAVDGEHIVGQSCALVEPLVIHGHEYHVGWGVDFFVLPEYRGKRVGTRLQQANNAGNEIFMSLSMAASAARIKSNIGLLPLPSVPLFTKILRHEPESVLRTLVERTKLPESLLRRAGVHRVGARWLTARAVGDDGAQRSFAAPVGVELIPVQQFGPEIDDLWARFSGKFNALVRRDSEYLNWKFTQQPHVEHQRVVVWRDGQARGYIIFRRAVPPERNVGLILDVFTNPNDDDTIRALLIYASRQLSAQGVAYLMAASSVPEFQRVYLALGFKPTKEAVPMVRAGLSVPREGWLFGKGDHDWDQFPLA